jgi:hypothetical protein
MERGSGRRRKQTSSTVFPCVTSRGARISRCHQVNPHPVTYCLDGRSAARPWTTNLLPSP